MHTHEMSIARYNLYVENCLTSTSKGLTVDCYAFIYDIMEQEML